MAWGSANNNVSFAVYSTSYALLASGTSQALFSITPSGTNGLTEGFDIAALSDTDRFVWTYSTGGQTSSVVINDALGTVQNVGVTGNVSYIGNKVVGAPNGGYVILQQYTSSGTATQITSYYKVSASSYSQQYNYTVVGDNFNLGYVTPVAINAQGAVFAYVPRNGVAGAFYWTDMANSTSTIVLNPVSNAGTTNQGAVATLTDGTFVAVRTDINTPTYAVYAYSPYTTSQIIANSITLSGGIGAASSPTPCVCPTFDNGFVCGYKASSDYPAFFIGSTILTTYTQSIIAGTTVQNAPGILPSPSNGYIFKGVAVTTATAGGSGVVQNLGSAQLNSQYPAGTTYQAFDSTGTVIQGTRGTIIGRNVNMTGVA
jgi:hypothetical protein